MHNQCALHKGGETDIKGYALSQNSENTKLEVYFNKIIPGNYWILDLDENYQNVIVGEPCKKFMWFLSRNSVVTNEQLEKMKKTAIEKGFDISDLVLRPTDCPL